MLMPDNMMQSPIPQLETLGLETLESVAHELNLSSPQEGRDRAKQLMARFHYADEWRQQYDKAAIEAYKLYIGYREPRESEDAHRSNLHIPKTYEYIDTIRGRLVKAFCGVSRPYIDFLPAASSMDTPEIMQMNASKADVAAALVDHQLEINNFPAKLYDFVTSMLVFPCGIMSVGWRYDERTVRRRVEVPRLMYTPMGYQVQYESIIQDVPHVEWDDNELQIVDFFDFWPDPRSSNIDDCRFVFQRQWLTREQLISMLELYSESGVGEFFELDYESLQEAGDALEEGRTARLESIGMVAESRDGFSEGTEEDEDRDEEHNLFEVLHYWEDDRRVIIVNREQVVCDTPNPYWRHGKKPFVVSTFEPMPNEFYGKSAVSIIEHLQHEENTNRNQRIDNVSLVLNRMWRVTPGADINEDELVSQPHGVVHANPNEIEALVVPDVTRSGYTEEQITTQDMENALGVPAIVRGVTPGRRETATEVVTKSSNASIRFDVKILLFDVLAIKRLAKLMDCNNQQFVTGQRLVTLGYEAGGPQWQQIQPGDLLGEHDYRPAGSGIDPSANKETRRQQLLQLLQMAMAFQAPMIDKFALWEMLLESFDVRNPAGLLIPKEVLVQQMMQMQQQLQMQQMQQQPPGSPGLQGQPAPGGAPLQPGAGPPAMGGGPGAY